MSEFKLDPDADINHTGRLARVMLPPRRMVDVFGPPGDADGYKVSGEYVFTDPDGNVFTVYDWKATSLFDDGLEQGEESSYPTPEEFWGNWNPDELNIGGREGAGDVQAFKRWLIEQTV
jgi:secreted protein with Ig-like and vWFA domain